MMKCIFLFLFLVYSALGITQEQTTKSPDDVVITSEPDKTHVRAHVNGKLLINVSPKNVRKFKARGFVRYSDFGAVGDGKTDDINAIAAAHAFANQHGLSVKAGEKATYYISGKKRTAIIQTDTDFGMAAFIIDDTDV
ncbi:MAG: hypothetical protein ACOC10_07050, partial [Bacteroidota bacterium]